MQHSPVPIPLAPLIDMVFLILVFFMCVSHLSDPAQALEIDLPEAGKRSQERPGDAIATIFIVADGTIHYGGRVVDAEALAADLALRNGGEIEPRIRLKAHRQASWSTVYPVIEVLTRAGVGKLVITSVEEGSGS